MNPTALEIASQVADTIRSTSRNAWPEEGCGYLIGARLGGTVDDAQTTKNVHPGPRESRYLVDPLDFLRLEERLEHKGRQVVGIFHSHPGSPAIPSPTDLAAALPDLYYLVHDVRPEGTDDIRAWRLAADGTAFVEIPLKIGAGQ